MIPQHIRDYLEYLAYLEGIEVFTPAYAEVKRMICVLALDPRFPEFFNESTLLAKRNLIDQCYSVDYTDPDSVMHCLNAIAYWQHNFDLYKELDLYHAFDSLPSINTYSSTKSLTTVSTFATTNSLMGSDPLLSNNQNQLFIENIEDISVDTLANSINFSECPSVCTKIGHAETLAAPSRVFPITTTEGYTEEVVFKFDYSLVKCDKFIASIAKDEDIITM